MLKLASKSNSSIFVELLCRPGFRSNLIRPQKMTFYKKEFMKYLKNEIIIFYKIQKQKKKAICTRPIIFI